MSEPDFTDIVGEHRAAHPYFLDGVKAERDRIIALLEGRLPDYGDVGKYVVRHLIVHIKGEN